MSITILLVQLRHSARSAKETGNLDTALLIFQAVKVIEGLSAENEKMQRMLGLGPQRDAQSPKGDTEGTAPPLTR